MSFFSIKNTNTTWGNFKGLIYLFLNCFWWTYTPLPSLSLIMVILSSFLVQTPFLSLSYNLILSLLTFFYLLSFWRYEYTYGILKVPISWPLLQISLLSSSYFKSSTLLLPSSPPLFSPFLFFYSFFFLFPFFVSSLLIYFPPLLSFILPSTSYSSLLVAYALVFKIQRMKLGNETKTTMKPAKALQACGYFFICNLISIQWLILPCKSLFHASFFTFHSHSSLFLYSGLCQLPIWWIPTLFNCLNAYNLVKLSCEFSQLIASHSWVVFLVFGDLSYLISGSVNGYHTAS